MPTRVRRRRSSRLLTVRFSTAYCTSPAVTASHSHTRLVAQPTFAEPDRRSVPVAVNRGTAQRGGQGDDFLQRFFGGLTDPAVVVLPSRTALVFPSLRQTASVAHSAIRR